MAARTPLLSTVVFSQPSECLDKRHICYEGRNYTSEKQNNDRKHQLKAVAAYNENLCYCKKCSDN